MVDKDIYGNEWARLSVLKPGMQVRTDNGFTCMKEGEVLTVQADDKGELFIPCTDENGDGSKGRHYLEGQADDGDHLVGLYPVNLIHA